VLSSSVAYGVLPVAAKEAWRHAGKAQQELELAAA